MSVNMRAKMFVTNIEKHGETSETLNFAGVSKSNGYPPDGSDENNTFAKWSPSVNLKMQITNPALIGKFAAGETFYVDFTPTEK